jgi:hypothetical protein
MIRIENKFNIGFFIDNYSLILFNYNNKDK